MGEPKKPIRAIFFDIGGVLVSSFGEDLIEYASEILGIEDKNLRVLIDQAQDDLLRGEVKGKDQVHPNKQHIEFWYDVMTLANKQDISMKEKTPSRRELAQIWVKPYLDNVRKYDEMIELVRNLKKNTELEIFTLSNIQEPHIMILKKMLGDDFDDLFDGHILSPEVHARKPDAEIYRLALNKPECSPEEAILVEDDKINIDGAKKLGINTILHIEGDTTRLKNILRETYRIELNETAYEPNAEMKISRS